MKDQLKQAIIAGDAGTVSALTQALLATGASPREILDEALLPGMEVVGERMRSGDCFIPEVLLSARTMQGALDLLRPHMAEGESTSAGTVVIGTVEGDRAKETQLVKAFTASGLQYASQLAPPAPPRPTGDPVADAAALAKWDRDQSGAEPPDWKIRVDTSAKTPCHT